MLQPDAPVNPYDRPLGRRWIVAFAMMALTMAGLLVLALTVERWMPDRRGFKQALAAVLVPYEELYLAGMPGQEGVEYVVFLSDEGRPAEIERFFASQRLVREERKSSIDGLLIVTLSGDRATALELLGAQPFVRLAVRNQGAFFCH